MWKTIPNYKKYEANDETGEIRSLDYNHTGKTVILKLGDNKGYKRIFNTLVHRLIWETFNGPIPKGYQVNHINEDKSDNRLSNLNLMTPKENINWGTGVNRRNITQRNRKIDSRKILQFDLQGNFIKEWPSFKEIERELGFFTANIWACCNGKYKKSYNYIWKYKNI